MDVQAQIEMALTDAHKRGIAYAPRDIYERRALQRRTRTPHGEICNPFPRLFVHTSWWNSLTPVERSDAIIKTIALLHPDWVFCSVSAAVLLGICDSYFLQDGRIHITTGEKFHQRSEKWITRHYMTPQDHNDVELVHGIAVTSMLRTTFDCARELDFAQSLGIIDAVLRRYYTRDTLLQYFHRHRKLQNARRALIAASYGDELSENGGESFARAQMILLGFEPLQLQVNFFDPIKRRYSRVDYLWTTAAGETVIFEYHGKQKYWDPTMTQGKSVNEVLSAEQKRASRLSLHNVRVDDIDFDDCRNPRILRRELEQYKVPRRKSARPGFLEFNRKLPSPGASYPRSIQV